MQRLTQTKLFLDGGDPAETAEATRLLNEAGYAGLDGQTTNPSLVAKNPDIAERIERGEKLEREELLNKYKEIVQQIEQDAAGDISIEVYADEDTSAQDMIGQAQEFASWIESAVIKLPTTEQGLIAAEELKDELRLNMTLCFSQQQAAACYAATRGAAHPVFISPFMGRLDDHGHNGVDVVANNLRMLEAGDGHIQVLAASVRHVDHIIESVRLGTHAITIPFDRAFKPWAEQGFPLADEEYVYESQGEAILYQELDLSASWDSFDIQHDLTDKGLQKFADDWNALQTNS